MEKVLITLSIPQAEHFEEVLAAARALGLAVEESFPKLGVVTGSIATEHLPALRGVPGLGSVEEQRTYKAL